MLSPNFVPHKKSHIAYMSGLAGSRSRVYLPYARLRLPKCRNTLPRLRILTTLTRWMFPRTLSPTSEEPSLPVSGWPPAPGICTRRPAVWAAPPTPPSTSSSPQTFKHVSMYIKRIFFFKIPQHHKFTVQKYSANFLQVFYITEMDFYRSVKIMSDV